jgi:transposase
MKWLDERVEQVPPTSKLGEAIGYARRQMPKIMRYLDAWFLTPDNNAVERAIRPFVIGRSNWLFSDTPRGAHASAAIYSLVETAKANGLEPYHYFRYLFTHLPTANSEEDLEKLLPMNLRPTDLLDF